MQPLIQTIKPEIKTVDKKKVTYIYLTESEIKQVKDIAKQFGVKTVSDLLRILILIKKNQSITRGMISK